MKKSIKLRLCNILYYSGLVHLFLKHIIARRCSAAVLIVNYHNFVESLENVIDIESSVTHQIEDVSEQIDFLMRYFRIVPLGQSVEILASRRAAVGPTVSLTVDDGLRSAYDLLFPIVTKKSLPITIFLTTGFIGTNTKPWFERLSHIIQLTDRGAFAFDEIASGREFVLTSLCAKRQAYQEIVEIMKGWNTQKRDNCIDNLSFLLSVVETKSSLMLNWDQVHEMSLSGVIFGAHTMTHPILTKIAGAEAKKEILESKQCIEDRLGYSDCHFAYPNGQPQDFNDELGSFCKGIGFKSVSTSIFGVNRGPEDIWRLKRIGFCAPLSVFAVNIVRALLFR